MATGTTTRLVLRIVNTSYNRGGHFLRPPLIYKEIEMSKEKIIFDASSYDYLMRNNGCSVGFNMPDALEGENTHGLPPYRKRMPYLVDKYPGCPSDWLKSEGKVCARCRRKRNVVRF